MNTERNNALDVDALAQEIRRVDGNHKLGACASPVAQDEREAFEQHWYDFYHSGSVKARPDGTYMHTIVQAAWDAWQARAATPAQDKPAGSQDAVDAAKPGSNAVNAASDVLAERRRQVEQEGYDAEHDDEHPSGEIAAMAAFYALPPDARVWPATETGYGDTFAEAIVPHDWPIPPNGDRRRELVKAGALILAEIERLDRAAMQAQGERND